MRPRLTLMTAAWLLLALTAAQADVMRLMTWNIEGGEQPPRVIAERVEAALSMVGPVDVLMLQEVIDAAQIEAAAEAGGFAHWAISDFSPPTRITGAWHQSLEVAILSRRPFTAVSEWDLTGRRPEGDGHPPRVSDAEIPSRELRIALDTAEPVPSRGFLRADLANGWTLYAVHWMSSRGQDCTAKDRENARLREVQAAGLVKDAARVLEAGRSLLIAGDFNIQAPGRVLRVGTDPGEDCAPTGGTCKDLCGPAGRDGYDDSIAILLGMDASARLLSSNLDATYVLRRFPGGAIDHILVAGPEAASFAEASTPPVRGKRWNGSDHRPVLTSMTR
ncbi:MAG: endonuclease/exonuclease/phosphatase family protein [Lamprobacter sp.]|uniref:endonuclease/exonuclease/phosphatase family protein n=1 Tax=Lamprobacter sp. TaxID=3100796 RepID=UPI002B25FB64|nr:endonuclease/exonuclease/phosphatase family protein [Lamprobacter sp.]MEA3639386.1 endonuclease/exonuclease/phosphatase family protein [Lamprobacter sp.]